MNRPPEVGLVANGLIRYAVPLVLRAFGLPRGTPECLLFTRVCVDAARLLGVDAYPLAVAYVLTPRDVARDKRAVVLGLSLTERARLRAATLVETDPRDERWPGHVLAVLGRRWLVDPTLDQANAHVPALEVEPYAWAFPTNAQAERWQRGRAEVALTTEAGTEIRIIARPTDRSFRAEPAWTRTDVDDVASLAAEAVRQRTAFPV